MTAGATYAAAGVDIDAGERLVRRIAPLARGTRRPEILAGVGGFAALAPRARVGAAGPACAPRRRAPAADAHLRPTGVGPPREGTPSGARHGAHHRRRSPRQRPARPARGLPRRGPTRLVADAADLRA